MSDDRLQQIWAGFEQVTTRNLTGRGVDNIPRPVVEETERHRSLLEDAHRATSVPMPDGVTEPAEAAFAALQRQMMPLDGKGKAKGRKSRAKQSLGEQPVVPETSVPKLDQDEQLFKDLKTTEMLTTRRDGDYDTWLAAREEERRSQKKRKKFLGIF